MKVQTPFEKSPRLWTVIRFGPRIRAAVDARSDGLLRFSPFPLHARMRQYWRDFDTDRLPPLRMRQRAHPRFEVYVQNSAPGGSDRARPQADGADVHAGPAAFQAGVPRARFDAAWCYQQGIPYREDPSDPR